MTTVPQAPRPTNGRSAWLREPDEKPPKLKPGWVSAAYFVGGVAYVGAGAYALTKSDSTILGGLIVVVPLALIASLVAKLLAEHDKDPAIAQLVMGAFVVHMIGTGARYWMAFSLYNGEADAKQYDLAGRKIGQAWRSFSPTFKTGSPGRLAGTNWMKVWTGIVYSFTPMSRLSGFFVYGFIAFIGCIFYWRAFKVAFPGGEVHRYALLVLLFPSIVFWPSAIGKDGWMALALGVAAYGAARLSAGFTVSGLVGVLLGLGGVILSRPHLGICVFAGLTFMMVLILTRLRKQRRPVLPVLACLVLAIMGNLVMSQTKSFLGTPSLTQEDLTTTLNSTQAHSAEGGSQFTAVRVNSPVKFPFGFATVFYRPFPFETHNTQELVAGMEGFLLIILTWKWRRNLYATFSGMRASPYIGYCVAYIIVFVIAFSSFSNFGLLARERTQVTPLYLALLAIPTRAQLKKARQENAVATSSAATAA
jgi:hypothetical protein